MVALGSHIIAELSHCRPELLSDLEQVREAMIRAAQKAGAEIREVAFHRFTPHGVSGVVVIAESHLSIHTWPELGYAAIDVYTCGPHTDPWQACDYLADFFGCRSLTATVVERGLPNRFGSYGHVVVTRNHQRRKASLSA
ncbi:MAG TPA: adenosylmethionine decarboxylase [Candidatus Nitrosotenuis sp.]|jgi:S-adenosylmethionine decarboxylase|nr:adenosylmethionine decarboxylase [Candidatus Nitrosotenuis sp.]